MGFKLNLGGMTPDQADRENRAEPGWYRVKLKDTYEDDENGAQVLEFVVTDGPFAGTVVKQLLFNPDMAEDESRAKASADKATKWARRLGIAPDDAFGREDFEPDWISAIGNEYVLELERTKNKATGKEFTGPKYLGVYPLTHEKIPDKVRAELKLPPAVRKQGNSGGGTHTTAPTAGAAAPAASGVDVSDL